MSANRKKLRNRHKDASNGPFPENTSSVSSAPEALWQEIHNAHKPEAAPIRAWTRGVAFDENARRQVFNVAGMPFVFKWLAIMPDVHAGKGATIGSVIPTRGAIIPAAVGVDIGCGMMAVRTSLTADDLPDSLKAIRSVIEKAVPHGRTHGGRRNDRGAWNDVPAEVGRLWQSQLHSDFQRIQERHPELGNPNHVNHLGTLGTGNHFIEMCLDESDRVWFMLHSGSRGVGNRIGTYFIELARKDMRTHLADLPDRDLAYLKEGTAHFDDYVFAVEWAQKYAMLNRSMMMERLLNAIATARLLPEFDARLEAVNCHHNYVARERHYGEEVLVTRKGAVRAGAGQLGIIPGSMGARSFIVRGRGNPVSFESCSHGAGRMMSRGEAKRRFSLEDHLKATAGVECRKDNGVIDETPAAYKPIDKVMAAQSDLVEIIHTLRQVICVKG
ncbi:MAG: RtcB family protein [Leptospiraceae bacterium]|nr:RtcB family protein [Leptospiraceae bacterium]